MFDLSMPHEICLKWRTFISSFAGLMQSDGEIKNGRHFLSALERSILMQTIEEYFQLPQCSKTDPSSSRWSLNGSPRSTADGPTA
jgi:hypothetical protein